ncbi:MAG TPA: tetratricopeptide repeat protein, partial [Roseiflexaceae bacterium]|nr:tetratricopeptide repeat protein [Roseiflexaceae bacterium]
MQSSPHPFDIRWLCAVLRRIDDDVLAALAHADFATAAELLGDALECLDGAHWRVRAEHAERLLLELQRSAPTHEVDLHHQAFCYYLERLRQPESARPGDADDCLYHLDRLFVLVGGQIDWQTIARYAADVRLATAIEIHHLQRLDLYEGYSAIRLQQYSSGEALLLPLADDEAAAPDVRARALKGLADGAYMRSQYEAALERYQRLLDVAASSGDETYQGLALLNIGLVLHELDRNDEALAFCERSMALFQRTGDRVREAHARYHTALYSMYLGRWQEAATHAGLVATLFEHLGLTNFLGYVYWLRGYLSHMLGDEAASDAYYQRALPLAETQHGHLALAMDIWLYRGFLLQTQGHADQALECYQHAVEAAERLERPHALCVIYFRIGQTLQHAGRRHEALSAFETA